MEVLKKQEIWYHGAPNVLTMLKKGSIITLERDLARVFSHKPPCVTVNVDGEIKHNGTKEGYLYLIDEPIGDCDIYTHPETSLEPGMEWLTRRALKLKLIGKTVVMDSERLSDEELMAILEARIGNGTEW